MMGVGKVWNGHSLDMKKLEGLVMGVEKGIKCAFYGHFGIRKGLCWVCKN